MTPHQLMLIASRCLVSPRVQPLQRTRRKHSWWQMALYIHRMFVPTGVAAAGTTAVPAFTDTSGLSTEIQAAITALASHGIQLEQLLLHSHQMTMSHVSRWLCSLMSLRL